MATFKEIQQSVEDAAQAVRDDPTLAADPATVIALQDNVALLASLSRLPVEPQKHPRKVK